MTEIVTLEVPAVQFLRPDARQNPGFIDVPHTPERAEKLKEIQKHDLRFTLELMMGNMVNICLDNPAMGFDYKFELAHNGPEYVEKVCEIIDNFTTEDYLDFVKQFKAGERG